MNDYFPNKLPRRDLTPEEKTQMARKFRRQARLTDALCLLGFLLWLAGRRLPVDLELLALVLLLGWILCGTVTFARRPCRRRLSDR